MICHLYRGHWEMILQQLATSSDTKFAETVGGRVREAIEEQPDAVCVMVEGQAVGFRKLAEVIRETLPEVSNVIVMLCAAADAVKWWDKVDVVMGVSK